MRTRAPFGSDTAVGRVLPSAQESHHIIARNQKISSRQLKTGKTVGRAGELVAGFKHGVGILGSCLTKAFYDFRDLFTRTDFYKSNIEKISEAWIPPKAL
mgnify:CR=1 FL=1